MEQQTSSNIASFVIRFIQSESPLASEVAAERRPSYRGTIRHIQSDEEISFTRWGDAIDFIRRFIQLEREEG